MKLSSRQLVAPVLVFLAVIISAGPVALAQSTQYRLRQALLLEQRAVQAAERGDVDSAIEQCRQAAELYRSLGERQGEAACLLYIGSAEQERGHSAEALAKLKASQALYEGLPAAPPEQMAQIHYFLAQAYSSLGQRDDAIRHLEEAPLWFRRSRSSLHAAMGLAKTSLIEVRISRLKEASALLEESLPILRKTGSPSHVAPCLQSLAEVYQLQGRFEKALPVALESLQLQPDGFAYKTLGSVYLGKGSYDEALKAFEKAESLHQRAGDQLNVWVVRTSKARVYYSQGRTEAALALYEGAVKAFRSQGEAEQLPAALVGTGAVYRLQGRFEEARKVYQEALDLHRRTGNKSGEAVALNNLAAIDLALGSWDEGLARLEESLAIRRETGDRQGEAATLANTGHLLAEFGYLEEAAIRFQKALEISREIGDPQLVSMNLQKLAQILFLKSPDEALALTEQALRQANELDDRPAELAALKLKALMLASQGNHTQALEVTSKALDLSREAGDRAAEAEVVTLEGLIRWRAGQKEHAVKILREAVRAMEAIGQGSRGTALVALGTIEESNGRPQEAIEAYRRAVEAEEQISNQIHTDDLLQGFRGSTNQAYQQLMRLLAESNPEGAFAVAEQARAQAFLRQLGNRRIDVRKGADPGLAEEGERLRSRLRDLDRQIGEERRKPFDQQSQGLLEYLARETDQARRQYENVLIRLKQTNPEYASLIRPSTLELAEVQKLIGPGATLIQYFSLDEQLLVWVIEQDSYQLFRLPVPSDSLAERIALLRNRIASREAEGEVSSALYKDLFAPLVPGIHHENLMIVPHGALHSLPFAALLDGKSRPLTERYRITLLPSASVMPFLREKRSPNEGRLLVLGDPDGSLSHAREEARAIAALYGKEPLLGTKAAESAVRKETGRVDVLHLAAHAVYDPARPLFSRIELAPGDGEDGRLELHEVFNLDLSGTNLIVLSGCGTALGNPTGGDDLTGFTRAFLYAGVPAVLATLWPVDDEASSALMASFHRHLRQGAPLAKALQAAQSEIAKEEKWRSPYYWAGYILTGDGG